MCEGRVQDWLGIFGDLHVWGAGFWKTRAAELPRHFCQWFPCTQTQDNGAEGEDVFEAGTTEGDNQDAKPRAKTAGVGHDQQVSVSSKYAVPSQSQVEAGEDSDGVVDLTLDDDGIAKTCVQGVDAYHDFMPMYKELCKMGNVSGHNGSLCRKIIWEAYTQLAESATALLLSQASAQELCLIQK